MRAMLMPMLVEKAPALPLTKHRDPRTQPRFPGLASHFEISHQHGSFTPCGNRVPKDRRKREPWRVDCRKCLASPQWLDAWKHYLATEANK
jgi:hypothetical protein